MKSKYGTLNDAMDGLIMIRGFMETLLKQLEIEENYEACAELLQEIDDINKEIDEHKRLQYLQQITGRKVSVY